MPYCEQTDLNTGPIVDLLKKEKDSGEILVSEEALEEILPLSSVKTRHKRMKDRCFSKHDTGYMNYGEKGITVADVWRGRGGLRNFRRWLVMQGMTNKNKGFWTVGRKEVDSNYGPETCSLETKIMQQRNKSGTVWVTDETTGEKVCLKQYCEITGENYGTACKRYRAGKPLKHKSFMHLRPCSEYSIARVTPDGSCQTFQDKEAFDYWVDRERSKVWDSVRGSSIPAFSSEWFLYKRSDDDDGLYHLIDGKYVRAEARSPKQPKVGTKRELYSIVNEAKEIISVLTSYISAA